MQQNVKITLYNPRVTRVLNNREIVVHTATQPYYLPTQTENSYSATTRLAGIQTTVALQALSAYGDTEMKEQVITSTTQHRNTLVCYTTEKMDRWSVKQE